MLSMKQKTARFKPKVVKNHKGSLEGIFARKGNSTKTIAELVETLTTRCGSSAMTRLMLVFAFLIITPSHAQAEDDLKPLFSLTLKELMQFKIASPSRLPVASMNMPGSVTVIEHDDLQEQLAITSDLAAVLGQLVPGMGTSSASPANIQTSLRGRKPVFFIDGVPITPTLNDVGREMRLIDPAIIERIEVVRSSSALFGNSAGAGFINYITGKDVKGPLKMSTEVGSQFSLTSLGNGFRPSVRQSFSGGGDIVDYRLVGYYEKTGGFFDAEGDRIAPIPNGFSGLSDSRIRSIYGRVGIDSGAGRFELSVNHYSQEQKTDYKTLPGNVAERIKARAIPKEPGDVEEANQFNENSLASISYTHPDVAGTGLRTILYFQNSKSTFGLAADRFTKTDKPSGQSDTSSQKYGARVDLYTPLDFVNEGAELLWGFDYLRDKTRADLVDGRVFAPAQELDSKAVFAQLRFSPLDGLAVTAGIRQEWSTLELDDFTSLLAYATSSVVRDDEGNIIYAELSRITGGLLSNNATPLNAGVTYSLSENINLFAGFSQGFQLTGVGSELRGWPEHVNVTVLQPEPNLIDSYEAGLTGNWEGISTSLTVFTSRSSNGRSFKPDPDDPRFAQLSRAADKVYGVETTFDAAISDRWRMGGSFTWMEGKVDWDSDGEFERPLQNRRIPPTIITLHLEHDVTETWAIRLQGLYSGERNKFPNSDNIWEGHIHPWLLVDVSARGRMGPGTLIIGVNNLLNANYFTNISESTQTNNSFSKAPGATLTLKYRIEY